MQIIDLNLINKKQWEDFLLEQKIDEVFFTLEWKEFIQKVFGYRAAYSLVKYNNKIVGIIPLFLVPSKLFGNRLISLPFCDHGGILFSKDMSEKNKKSIRKAYLDYVWKIFKKKQIDYIELRGKAAFNESFECYQYNTLPYSNFCLSLEGQSLEDITTGFSENIRRILKRTKGDFVIEECKDRKLIVLIYGIYVENMRKFGSPVLPLSYFQNAWDVFYEKNMFKIFLAKNNSNIIGAITLLVLKKKVYAEHIFSIGNKLQQMAKINLYYCTIKWAFENKKKIYDFGRARKDSGVYEHKRRWGAQERGISYAYLSFKKRYIFEIDYNRIVFIAGKIFFKYCPLNLSKRIGPFIRSQAGK